MHGTTVCVVHGGAAGQVRAKAKRRLAAQRAERAVRKLGDLRSDVEPLDALMDSLREAAAAAEAYRLVIADFGVEVGLTGVAGHDHLGDAVPHVLVEEYRRWSADRARYAKMAIDAGVDERRVRIAENHAERLARALGRALDDDSVALTEDQRVAIRQALGRELRREIGVAAT